MASPDPDSFRWKYSSEWGAIPVQRKQDRWWLHILLLGLTFFTTLVLGARLAENFEHNLPPFDLDFDWAGFLYAVRHPSILLKGLPYSLSLLLILMAHEMGHYLACRYYRIDASLPYFLPAPTFIGTFGAFIRFRAAVPGRKELFDVGVAGPLAGFAMVIPLLGVGLALSKVVPGLGGHADLVLGSPLLLRLLEEWLFPGAATMDIYLHPVARAAWVGMLATALNLLPVGQLDGGHLVYACFGERHRQISITACLLLAPLGLVYWPWFLWSAVLLFLGRKHFAVYSSGPLGAARYRVLALAALLFALCFIPAPVQVK